MAEDSNDLVDLLNKELNKFSSLFGDNTKSFLLLKKADSNIYEIPKDYDIFKVIYSKDYGFFIEKTNFSDLKEYISNLEEIGYSYEYNVSGLEKEFLNGLLDNYCFVSLSFNDDKKLVVDETFNLCSFLNYLSNKEEKTVTESIFNFFGDYLKEITRNITKKNLYKDPFFLKEYE